MTEPLKAPDLDIRPVHILAGLGGAERDLLATSLALFDDSTWIKRLTRVWQRLTDEGRRVANEELDEAERELRSSVNRWKASPWEDHDLRFILWARLRETMGLPPRLSATRRGCSHLADDLSARLIHFIDPPNLAKPAKRWLYQKGWLKKDEQAVSLGDIVLPVLDELLLESPHAHNFPSDQEARRQALTYAVAALNRLTESEQEQLIRDLDADRLNDSAILKTLLVGGSLGAFGVGVSSAGFSAYILAAQASAFVPFVSGPGLVSFVSVLSNPMTILAVTGGGALWFMRSARQRINANIAARVVAMLTIQGLQTGTGGLDSLRACFAGITRRNEYDGISRKVFDFYWQEWKLVESLWANKTKTPPAAVFEVMDKPLRPEVPELGLAPSKDSTPTGNERANAAALATMTVGDVLYSAASVDPTVIKAANFSRLADIEGRLSFAELAQGLLDGTAPAVQGGINQLKGYVAEKAVAAELAAAGHAVSFPDASNSPGWDIMVDGQPFQVKFHETLQGIRRHVERYDYPVIANTELQDSIPEELQDRVFFVDGLSNEVVTHVTERSSAAAVEITEAGSPAMVGLISTTRGLIAYRSGQVTGRQAFEQIMLDGTVRVGLFGAGGVAGATAGMLLFGPAGAWVLGAGLPILAQMQTPKVTRKLKGWIKGKAHRSWENQAHDALNELVEAVDSALVDKEKQFGEKMGIIPANKAGQYMRWRLADNYSFATECRVHLEQANQSEWPIPEQRAAEIFRVLAICAVHPAVYQSEIRAISTILEERPGLSELIDRKKLADASEPARREVRRGTEAVVKRVRESKAVKRTKEKLKGMNWFGLKPDRD